MGLCDILRNPGGAALACGLLLAAAVGESSVGPALADVRNPDSVAVIIGNRNYTGTGEVRFAHRDAAAFRRYVLDVLGFDPANVIHLEDATQAQMIGVFGNEQDPRGKLWFYLDPEEARKVSDVVVFYSGHGMPELSERTPGAYLLPTNASPSNPRLNGYSVETLYRNLAKLPARSVSVFLDACFTGRSGDGKPLLKASPVIQRAALPESVARNMTILTAARHDQLAYWDEKAGHGMFTHHLLDALHGGADADRNGEVTASEVGRYLKRHMRRAVRRTYQNDQVAQLLDGTGKGSAILASAVQGEFPKRALLRLEGTPDKKARTAVPPPPAHQAIETALGLDHQARIAVERGLVMLGRRIGHPDGLFGADTRTALRAWQAEKRVPVTGYLTRMQAEVLIAAGKPWSSLTLQTVPANAGVRVFTSKGSEAYRKGMVLTAGRYEVAVAAPQHETFRQRIDVSGPTSYRISLCKLETRMKNECPQNATAKHETRTRTMRKRDTQYVSGSYGRRACEDAFGLMFEDINGGGISEYNHGQRMIWLNGRGEGYLRRRCQQDGGAIQKISKAGFRGWHAEARCSCAREANDYTGKRKCEVSIAWRCAYREEIKPPGNCRNVPKTERSCPDKTVVRIK